MTPRWKIILTTVGVVLPALFTYMAARSDSNEAKIRAEVAYVSMQETVKELQETSYAQAIELAEIRGQLRGERRGKPEVAAAVRPPMALPPPVASKPEFPDAADADGILDPPAPQVKSKSKAPSFNDAVQSYKAKK